MKVYGTEITDAQQVTGCAAMQGEFTMGNVRKALVQAGVPADGAILCRAADRLLQKERKSGRIIAVNNKVWRRVGS